MESFTDVLGGDPSTGPADQDQAWGKVYSLCSSKEGFLFLINDQFIDIIALENIRYHLAVTGYPGYADGQADRVKFSMGIRSYYGLHSIVWSPYGKLYDADNGNNRVRGIL